jgi:hypothetical protein
MDDVLHLTVGSLDRAAAATVEVRGSTGGLQGVYRGSTGGTKGV